MDSIRGDFDVDRGTSFYASAIIGAAPAGVIAAQNDEQFSQFLQQGFEAYRKMGAKDMRLRNVNMVPIDKLHCLARVYWTAVYERGNDPDTSIDFEVHYLVQQLLGSPKIFGWIAGDEQAVLKKHGII